jgi:hypothetical protein
MLFPTPTYTPGEKVLVRLRGVAEPAVVVSTDGETAVVATAPDSNRTLSTADYLDWEQRTVALRLLRRYEW